MLYSQDGPPGAVAIMLFRGVLQSGVLVACYSLYSSRSISSASPQEQQQQQQLAAEQEQLAQQQRVQAVEAAVSGGGFSLVPAWVRRATAKLPLTAVAATELGTWLFLATGIQTAGLQLTTATRAGFLIQATALITPLLASLAGDKPSRNVWAGCIIALAGCLLIASDESALDPDDAAAAFSLGARLAGWLGCLPGAAARPPAPRCCFCWRLLVSPPPHTTPCLPPAGGDVAILASAFFFSLATVRLGKYARRIPSVELAAAKSVVLGTAAVATFGVAAGALLAAGEPLTDLWPGWTNPVSWSIMVWSALGPGAAAAFLHAKVGGRGVVGGGCPLGPADCWLTFRLLPASGTTQPARLPTLLPRPLSRSQGQSVVPPADAQVIFSTVPLWSIAFAFLLLGGEPLTGYTVAGGAAVVAAGLIASRKDEPQGVEAGKDA